MCNFISSLSYNSISVDQQRLKTHVKNIINTPKPRNFYNISSLNIVADYIDSTFAQFNENVVEFLQFLPRTYGYLAVPR